MRSSTMLQGCNSYTWVGHGNLVCASVGCAGMSLHQTVDDAPSSSSAVLAMGSGSDRSPYLLEAAGRKQPDGVYEMDSVSITGQSGVIIELPIARGATTGYDWVLDLPDGVVRADDSLAVPPQPDHSLGSASGASLRVVANAPGFYKLIARLVRSWQPGSPVRTMEIDLTVQ